VADAVFGIKKDVIAFPLKSVRVVVVTFSWGSISWADRTNKLMSGAEKLGLGHGNLALPRNFRQFNFQHCNK
jgi:hypothetical protein